MWKHTIHYLSVYRIWQFYRISMQILIIIFFFLNSRHQESMKQVYLSLFFCFRAFNTCWVVEYNIMTSLYCPLLRLFLWTALLYFYEHKRWRWWCIPITVTKHETNVTKFSWTVMFWHSLVDSEPFKLLKRRLTAALTILIIFTILPFSQNKFTISQKYFCNIFSDWFPMIDGR